MKKKKNKSQLDYMKDIRKPMSKLPYVSKNKKKEALDKRNKNYE